jgi:predicted DNA-binding transcriptional regulator AlpA
MEKILNEKEVALATRLALPTLRNWRSLGRGPAYLKLGKAIRYRESDVQAYVEKSRIEPDGIDGR